MFCNIGPWWRHRCSAYIPRATFKDTFYQQKVTRPPDTLDRIDIKNIVRLYCMFRKTKRYGESKSVRRFSVAPLGTEILALSLTSPNQLSVPLT